MKKINIILILILLYFGACSQKTATFDELVQSGQKSLTKENYAEARELLKQALKIKPSDRNALYFLGLAYQRDHIFDSALIYYKRGDLLYPKDRELNLGVFRCAMETKDWKNARDAVKVLIETGDPKSKYIDVLISLNISLKLYTVAFRDLKEKLNLTPDDPNTYLQLSNVAAQIDSLDYALEVMDMALARFGEKQEFMMNKAMYLTAMREYLKAEKLLRKILSQDTTVIPVKINLANVLSAQKNRDKKMEAYRLYKELQPLVSDVFKIDSTLKSLEIELNL